MHQTSAWEPFIGHTVNVARAYAWTQKTSVPIEIRPEVKFVLVSYALLTGQWKAGSQTNGHLRVTSSGASYKVIVADEAHALKSFASERTKTLMRMLHSASRVVLMTGTPMSNSSAAEVLPLLHAVAGAQVPIPSP